MAKHITSFWARLCGFFVGCISTIFCLDAKASAITDGYGALGASDRYQDCDDQNYDYTVYEDGTVDDVHPDKSTWDDVEPIYLTGIRCNNDVDIPASYGYDYYSLLSNRGWYGNYLCDGTLDQSSTSGCSLRESYDGDSAGLGANPGSGLFAYFGPFVRGHVLGCYQPDPTEDYGQIAVYGYCADAEVIIYGCGKMDMYGRFTSNKDSTGRPSYLINSNNKIQANVNSTTEMFNYGAFVSNVREDSDAPDFYAGYDADSAIEEVSDYYGYSCAKCAYDPLGNIQEISGALGYTGSTTVGATWNPNSCYFTAQTNLANTRQLSDASGTFIYPLATSDGCKCFYNQNNGNGLAECASS